MLHIPPLLIYLLVLILLLLESSGIPIVNTTLLLFVGALAALGRAHLGLLLLASIMGSTLGAGTAYGLGRRYGENFLLRLTKLLHIRIIRIHMAERWFQRAGMRMIFCSRLLPYVRPFACFLAGISAMSFKRFLASAVSGSILWCTFCLLIGWMLGPQWKTAMKLMQTYTWLALGLLSLLLLAYLLFRHIIKRYVKKNVETEEEEAAAEHDLLKV